MSECASGGERVSVRARGAGAVAARSLAGPGSVVVSACAWPAGRPGPTRPATRQGCGGTGQPSGADPPGCRKN